MPGRDGPSGPAETGLDVTDELREDYARAGFGGRLGWGGRPVLLLIDMMLAYFTPGSPLDLGDRSVVESCRRLLECARQAGVPVVHTRVRYARDAPDAGLFVRKVAALRFLAEGAPGELWRLVPELAPKSGEVVVIKQYASAFFGTSLASTLAAWGADTVVIGGVSTSGCVRASATDALQHGFRPLVVREACADRQSSIHEANLFDLNAKYADIVSEPEALARFAAIGETRSSRS